MNLVPLFEMCVFVAATYLGWPILLLHEQIMEEAKKFEKKNACGMLKKTFQIEKLVR